MDRPAPFVIRPLEHQDLPAALALQAAVFPAFLLEDEAAFASRLDLPASYCVAATTDDVLTGYLLAHGWPAQAPPAVDTILAAEQPAEVLFLHDLAVATAGRGARIGQALVDRAFALAARDGFVTAELIAVEGASSYWQALGFTEPAISSRLAAKVAGYGLGARWMTRTIPPA